MGHGEEGAFHINAAETLSANELDQWLDNAQAAITGPVIFIYDACWSGSFIKPLAGLSRYILTSGSEGASWFINDGQTSFSFQFWSAVSANANLNNAFIHSSAVMRDFQTANLDADGDGISGEAEDKLRAEAITIGRGRTVRMNILSIESAYTEPARLGGTTSAVAIALNLSFPDKDIEWVKATIIPTSYTPAKEAVFDEATLLYSVPNSRYEGTYDGFTIQGTYKIVITARLKDMHDSLSYPAYCILTQFAGTAPEADAYENDDTFDLASPIIINNPDAQRHTFHDQEDADWIRFEGVRNNIYEIRAFNLTSICDVGLSLYEAEGLTLIEEYESRTIGGRARMNPFTGNAPKTGFIT